MNNTNAHWLQGDQALNDLCEQLSQDEWVVLDTEFIRERTYYPIIGLLQFADAHQSYLLDPLTITDWSPLAKLLNSDLIWVMHACGEDLEVLHRITATVPKYIFDTQVAAAFLGLGAALGYAPLIEKLLDLQLDKSHSRTNWLARPLSPKQLQYAENDVKFLADCWQSLQSTLAEKKLMDYFQQDMQLLSSWQVSDPWLAYQKIKMAWTISSKTDIVKFQALSHWRECKARKLDRVKKHLIEDLQLVQLAQLSLPIDLEQLKLANILNAHKINQYGEEIITLLNAVDLENSTAEIIVRIVDVPMGKQMLSHWTEMAKKIAIKNEIPETVLFTKRSLSCLLLFKKGQLKNINKSWTKWRLELLDDALKV